MPTQNTTVIDNELIIFKNNIIKNRVNICKKIMDQTKSKSKNSYLIKDSKPELQKILQEYSPNKTLTPMMQQYTCFICTGKYTDVMIGDFDIISDEDFKILQLQKYYKDIKSNNIHLADIDETIFQGLEKLYKANPAKPQVSCKDPVINPEENDITHKVDLCKDPNSSVYKKIINKLDIKNVIKREKEEAKDNITILLGTYRKKIINRLASQTKTTTWIAQYGPETLNKFILKETTPPYKGYADTLIKISKDLTIQEKITNIIFSQGGHDTSLSITEFILNDNVDDLEDLRRANILKLLFPNSNLNNQNNVLTEGYLNYIKEYGFRK